MYDKNAKSLNPLLIREGFKHTHPRGASFRITCLNPLLIREGFKQKLLESFERAFRLNPLLIREGFKRVENSFVVIQYEVLIPC